MYELLPALVIVSVGFFETFSASTFCIATSKSAATSTAHILARAAIVGEVKLSIGQMLYR